MKILRLLLLCAVTLSACNVPQPPKTDPTPKIDPKPSPKKPVPCPCPREEDRP